MRLQAAGADETTLRKRTLMNLYHRRGAIGELWEYTQSHEYSFWMFQ